MNSTEQLRVYDNAGHDFFAWSNQKRFFDNIKTNLEGSESGAFAFFSSSVLTIGLAIIHLF